MAPVPDPGVSVGQDARSALARHRAALARADAALISSRAWYLRVRSDYAGSR